MTTLVYGISGAQAIPSSPGRPGVGGQPVRHVAHNGHAAACSGLAGSTPPMTVESIQVYNDVIQDLCRQATTIPVRYGTLFRNDREIRNYLAEHREENEKRLARIAGCAEMGIRIVDGGRQTTVCRAAAKDSGAHARASGQAYLLQRREHYACRDRHKTAMEAVARDCRAAFAGLFKESRCEFPAPDENADRAARPPMASLYFLVPRRAVSQFEAAFATFRQACGHQLTLSGPWPPYNFVTPDRRGLLAGIAAAKD